MSAYHQADIKHSSADVGAAAVAVAGGRDSVIRFGKVIIVIDSCWIPPTAQQHPPHFYF